MHDMQLKIKKMMTYRWVVWGVLVLAYIIVFFHRLAIGVVREDLVEAYGVSATTFANIGSTYFYAYMLMQIPSGILADTLGARKTVSFGTLLAGIGSIVFGFAPNLFMVFFGRLLVGIGVSVVFISILKVQSSWFKESEFATMSGITSFVGNMGGVMAQTPLAIMVAYFTWRNTFAAIGILSIILALVAFWVVRNTPADMGLPTIEEIEGEKKSTQTMESPPLLKSLLQALTNWNTWPSFFVFTGFFGAYVALTGTWGLSYLVDVYKLDPAVAPNYLTVAVFGLAIGSYTIGKFSDSIKKRKLPMILFGGVYTLCWGILVFMNGGRPPIVILYPLFFTLGFTCSTFVLGWACGKEVNHPAIAGISTSIVNIGGFLGGAVIPPILGYVFDTYGGQLEPVQLFQKAFLYCFIFVAASYLFTFAVKETHCKNIFNILK
ncbi:MFS transporter [Alkaliphilus peptidifermentans]|uniref:Sugar phosphate permease n=1 Tax=Alkaliphilus peptidifermentans DSM 18978 TaxID=1120976 RepID=A0A1G5IEC2_9FIRM|nr:MFS transporter [Alkaliphilus peptidifermentans]SCY74353.1 Sugar phosphate permease [Alkaliphilus peptidifermentans DSM 18978]